ncbi:hypothetical protein ERO13_A07G111250v2 [Gossypium hirsutum]|nr:hypothetical protein ERO13_A07G111250v2 [Gossypium hirsutum]
MAATFSSPSTVVRLGSATSFSSPPNKTCLSSGFLKSSVRGRNPLRLAGACGGKFTCFERDWLRRDFNVI